MTTWIFLGIVLLVLCVILAGGFLKLQDFLKELNYLKREIARTAGKERAYYEKEKRRLWLSLLPFFRR